MADDPNPNPNPNPDPKPEPPPTQSLSEEEVKGLVASVIDEKLGGKLDKLDLLDNLSEHIEGLFEKHKPNEDRTGLLSDIDKLVSDKLRGLGGGNTSPTATERKGGPISRWLGF